LYRLRPELISMFIRMQKIRHDAGRHFAIRAEENMIDIQECDHPVVAELGDAFVYLANRVDLLRRIGRAVARENGEQQDFGFRTFLAHDRDDLLHAFRDLVRRIGAAVVGADHQHDDFRINAVEFAVFNAPENVLGAIPADAEIGGVTRTVKLLPDVFSTTAPKIRDGIAHEEKIDVAGFGLLNKPLMPRHPARRTRDWSRGRVVDGDFWRMGFVGSTTPGEQYREKERKEFLHAGKYRETSRSEQDSR